MAVPRSPQPPREHNPAPSRWRRERDEARAARDAALARVEELTAELEQLREANDLLRVETANATPDHDALAADAIEAHEEADRLRSELERMRRIATSGRAADDEAAARVGAWLDGHDPILPKAAVRSLLWQRAELLGERARLADRNEQLRDTLIVATRLLDELANETPCPDDDGLHLRLHGNNPPPCPHLLGRRFIETWGSQSLPELEDRLSKDGTS